MTYKFPPDTTFKVGTDEMFAMMSLAGCVVEALKRSIKEQIPEAKIDG